MNKPDIINMPFVPKIFSHICHLFLSPIFLTMNCIYIVSQLSVYFIFRRNVSFIGSIGMLIDPTVKIGRYTIIDKGVKIGSNVEIGDFVKLTSGTVIGDNCRIDDYVTTSGYCWIGNNVTIKRCTMIGQACKIRDGVWVGSHVTTTRVKYPGSITEQPTKEEWVTIEKDAVIGSSSLLMAGITIGHDAVVGSGAIVSEDCIPGGIYTGNKAELRRIRKGFEEAV